MKPYYETPLGKLHHGDCLEIMPELEPVDLVLTDPPYGISYSTKTRIIESSIRYAGGRYEKKYPQDILIGDDKQFNPKPFLKYPNVVLWGCNYYASKLHDCGGWLIWNKRRDGNLCPGWHGADVELGYTNLVDTPKIFTYMWSGFRRDGEIGKHYHPTQKPIELMRWCLEFYKNKGIIFDPFLGSGTTAVACERLNRHWIGIEIEEKYCEIAAKRIEHEREQLKMFN